MVDTVSATSVSSRDLTVSRVTRTAPATPVATGGSTAVDQPAGATTLARTLSASAPVDADRVAAVKKAIQNGTFPISPATIADRLLALKLEWNSNDQA
jgi:negative regulator of flagellin synthesis FlgM